MLNSKKLSKQNIFDGSPTFLDHLKLEDLKQFLNAPAKLVTLSGKISKNEDVLASFLVQKAIPKESDINLKKAYQENFKLLLQYLKFSIVSGGREEIVELLREEILTHLVPEFMLSTLNTFVSFIRTLFLENDHFSPEDNEVLAEYIVRFNTLLKQIKDHQEDLQEKLLRWFDEVEQLEVLPSESCTPYQQSLVEKYRAKGLTL